MKRFFTLIILCSLIYACKPGIPKDIIQPDKMEKVLIDIHIVDGYMSTLNLPNQDTSKIVVAPLYRGVYKKFDIDSALYNKSLDFYYKHPDLMKKMYDSIGVKITVLKEQTSKAELMSLSEFKGVFDAASMDSNLLDRTLDRRYNLRYLVKQRYGNIGDVVSVTVPPMAVPAVLPPPAMPITKEAKPVLDTRTELKATPVQ